MLYAVLTTVFFAISAVSATRTAKLMGGNEANFWRLTLSTIFLAILAHSIGQGLSGSAFHILIISGVIGFGIGDVALFQALPRLGSRLTVMLVHCLTAPLAVISEWWWMGTEMTAGEIICGVAILCGVAIALAPKDHLHIPKATFWWGIHWAIWAAIGQAGGVVLSRKAYEITAAAGESLDGITAAYQRIIAGTVVAGFCLLFAKRTYLAAWINPDSDQDKTTMQSLSATAKWKKSGGWLLLNALTGATLGVSCYQWALKVEKPGVVLPIVALAPLVVIPMALVMEKEKPSARSLAGGLVAVGAAVVLAWIKYK
ncbi:MAG: EamA family transporter [Verrucomicrobiia bacterium]